ncbi:MAG: hypothetical protein OXG79_12605 [Chloroflexi bacterium]|nr:hypothetical protein [Chloroflexota bacterium]
MAVDSARAPFAPSPEAVAALADVAALWREASSRTTDARLSGMADAVAACWDHAHEQPTRDNYIAALTASRVTLAKHPELDVRLPVPPWASRRRREGGVPIA